MNDERPIEKLLRRAAQKRRDEAGPPPELHPANRRLLQAEVAKQFPQPTRAPATPPSASALKEFWAALTQRWVYAVGVFVILGIAALAVLPLFKKTDSGMNLAKLAPEEEAMPQAVWRTKPLRLNPQ